MQTLTRRGVGDAAAGLGLHFLHMSEGPFSHDAGHMDSLQEATGLKGLSIHKNVRNVVKSEMKIALLCTNVKTVYFYALYNEFIVKVYKPIV